MKKKVSLLLVVALLLCCFSFTSVALAYDGAKPLPALTGVQAEDVAQIALSQVGYREAADGTTVYGAWWGIPAGDWCAMFACWCANQAGAGFDRYSGASAQVTALFNFIKEKGTTDITFQTDPRPGDFLFFKDADPTKRLPHVGIVTAYDSATKKVTYVDGNSNNAVQIGTCKWESGAKVGAQYVYGYGRPAYSNSSTVTPTTPFIIENGVLTAYTGTDSVVVIPDGVTSIGNSAFWNCQSLTSIEIPNSVTSIEDLAFMWCSNLTSVEIPNSVTYIGLGAFEYTKWLENKRNENPFVIINSILIDAKTTTGDVKIPNSVTSIGAGAFESCSSLTSVEIPNSVTSISDRAFIWCRNLTSIEIPNSVTYIGEKAFYDCSSLTSVEIPNSVTYIGKGAFLYCSSLTSVKIPDSVTYIGESAFASCSSLTSVEIPNSVTSIGSWAFENCSSLISVEIPNSVTSIGDRAFWGCNNLTIYGDTDSYAQTYANENNIPFVELEKEETDIQEHEHDFSEYTVEKKATLNEWGTLVFNCSECDATEESEIPEVNAAVLAKYKYTYNGKNNKPSVTVTDVEGNKLVKGTDYSVKYSGNGKSVGRYKVTVTLKGLYSGTKNLYYYVMPKAPTGVEAIWDESDSVTVSWKKSTGATGYYVYYKESTEDTYIELGSTEELTYTEENLQQGVEYDFKIVPYYIANEKIYFSDNVAVKSINTHTSTFDIYETVPTVGN